MSKVWTINVQVNTLFLSNLAGKGTWENPIGGEKYFYDDVRMSAVSNDSNDKIIVGNDKDFALTVGKDDQINWIVSEVNPIYKNKRSVCMYGFAQGNDWDKSLTPPNTVVTETAFAALQNGFNAQYEPSGERFVTTSTSDISIPQTTVRSGAVDSSITYHMKLLLLDISNINEPSILKYIKIDPVIKIKL